MSNKTTREQIVEAADQLFYRNGFDSTSFADIAHAVNLSRGNFYFHFKTKDDILNAVIDLRLENTQKMLERWEMEGDRPEDRIRCFIHILIANRAKIKLFGCPVGTLCTELAKLNHPSENHANRIFTLFRSWLRLQFTLLGLPADADALAMHVLARSQGVATLANAFHEDKFLREEVKRLCDWLRACVAIATPNGHRECAVGKRAGRKPHRRGAVQRVKKQPRAQSRAVAQPAKE